MKPKIRKVKCIVYFEPDKIEGHIPIPGYEVVQETKHGYTLCGLGKTVEEAWEDYLDTKQHQMEVEEEIWK